MVWFFFVCFFFFKQKTAYEMRISDWSSDVCSSDLEGPPPPVDLKAEKRTGDFIRDAINAGWITACHDVSDGGVAVALAEMALKSNIGVLVSEEQPFGVAESFFGEDQGLYLVTVCDTRSEERRAGNECVRTCSSPAPPPT